MFDVYITLLPFLSVENIHPKLDIFLIFFWLHLFKTKCRRDLRLYITGT